MTWPTKEEIQPPETGRTSHYTGAFSEEIYPKRATSFWHLVVPQMNPQRHILLAPFWYTQKEMPKEYNILTWPHNLFFFLPVYLCSAKHRESLFLATFSSAPPPSHPVVVQGAASQKARMSPQRSFQDNTSTWNINACINHRHNSHKTAEPTPQTVHLGH